MAALLSSTQGAAATHARTVLYNGKIFTADECAPWAQAIAIQDDHILAVGTNADVLAVAKAGTRRIDLDGRTVVPGMNDAHVHVLSSPGVYLDTPAFIPGPGPTLSEVLGMIADGASMTPPGTWLVVIVGSNVMDDAGANRFALDTVSPDHPVKLEAFSGHGTYLNTTAMQALGIAEDEPDPFAGSYERVPGTQILTGVVHEYAEYMVRRKLLALTSTEELAERYRAFASGAARLGFTSIQDMAVGLPRMRSLEVLSEADLPIRVRSICFPLSPDEACDAPHQGHLGRITSTGIKWISDGSPIERRAFLTAPYSDRPDWFGLFNFPDDPVLDILSMGLSGSPRRHQLLFHAVGDGSIEHILGAMEATGGAEVWNGRRTRMEHGDLLFPENIARVADLGMVVVQNPTHFASTETFFERFGPERVSAMEPLSTLVSAGIPVALGTDAIGQPLSPWVDVLFAALHPTHPAEALTVEEAVTAYTMGSAYAEFQENKKGSLSPGKWADLAVLSQDVFTVPLAALPATTSVLTMVGGEVVWDAGELGL